MDKEMLDSYRRELRRRRTELFDKITNTETALAELGEEREREWSEEALEERMSHLLGLMDARDTEALAEIEEAMRRIDKGTYETCERCGREIAAERLQVMPTARLCAECEQIVATSPGAEEEPNFGRLPPDLSLLSDEEIQEEIAEQVHVDGRVDMDELQIRCRNGVIFLEGALPSERERSILLQFVTDVMGIEEVVDHLRVERLAWEREDRYRERPTRLEEKRPENDLYGSDEIIESSEEVLKEPPLLGEPAPEEE